MDSTGRFFPEHFVQNCCSEFLYRSFVQNFCSEFWFLGDSVLERSWRLSSSGPPQRNIFLNMLFRFFVQNFCSELLFRISGFRETRFF